METIQKKAEEGITSELALVQAAKERRSGGIQ